MRADARVGATTILTPLAQLGSPTARHGFPLPIRTRPPAVRAPEEEGTQAGCAEEGFGAHMADAVVLQVQLLKGLRQVRRHEGQLIVAKVQHLGRWAEMAPWWL